MTGERLSGERRCPICGDPMEWDDGSLRCLVCEEKAMDLADDPGDH